MISYEKYYCHDCKKEIKIKDKKILNGKYVKYSAGKEDYYVFKCNKCFKNIPELRNFQECEIYSRIVGYIRPTKQWNESKREEFRQRKNFKI